MAFTAMRRFLGVAVLTACACTVATRLPAQTPADGRAAASASAGRKTCETEQQRLGARAGELQQQAQRHNEDADEYAKSYKLVISMCETAKKSGKRHELEACRQSLDRAHARADAGNRAADQLAADRAALEGALDKHNRSCPAAQVRLLRQ